MAFNDKGLVVKRFNEILTDIQNDQIANIPQKFKYSNNKILYQLNNVYALQVERLAELVEAAFDSIKLQSAEGRNLEELGFIRGVYRLLPIPSSTNSQYAIMKPGTIIPAGTLFKSSLSNDTAIPVDDVVADTTACTNATIKINTVVNSTVYSLTINGETYSYTSDTTATVAEIRQGLINAFTADTTRTWTFVTGSGEGEIDFSANENTLLDIRANTTYLTITEVKVYFYLQLTEDGPVDVPKNTITSTVNPVSGLISTSNDKEFSQGRFKERDSDFRLRIINGNTGDCTGTVDTIESAVLTNVFGVSYANVIENTDVSPQDSAGRPIHSYETVVLGGANEAVAKEVWRTKPAAMQLFGNTNVTIKDGKGRDRIIKFSRPAPKNVAVRVTYQLYEEENPTEDLNGVIERVVLDYVGRLSLGKDLIPTRLYGPIYSNTTGLEGVTIEVQTLASSGATPGTWLTSTIPMSDVEYASIQPADVYIVSPV